MPKVSIVIPTVKDREEKFQRLIKSLKESTFHGQEVLIQDGTLGLASARNRGANQANGEYVLFIDDDNVAAPEMIAELVKTLDKERNLVAVGPVTYYLSKPKKVWFAGSKVSLWTSRPRFYSLKRGVGAKPFVLVQNLHNCFMVRRKVGAEVGWFNEAMVMSGTEADMFLRIRQKFPQAQIAVHLRAKCYHDIPLPSQDLMRSLGFNHPQRAYYFQRNRGYLISRHGRVSQKIIFGLIFYPLFTFGYAGFFVSKKRWGLLIAHLKGTLDGYGYLLNENSLV